MLTRRDNADNSSNEYNSNSCEVNNDNNNNNNNTRNNNSKIIVMMITTTTMTMTIMF